MLDIRLLNRRFALVGGRRDSVFPFKLANEFCFVIKAMRHS